MTPQLRRVVSLPLLVAFGLGNILGAGIYVLIGEIAGVAGPYTTIAFAVAMLLVAFTALTYAEFSGRLPGSAGPALFVAAGFERRWLATLTGLTLVGAGVVSAAVIANGFWGYLGTFVDLPRAAVISLLVLTLGALAAWGIAASVRTAALFTLLEVAGLALVAWSGAGYLDPAAHVHAWSAGWQGLTSIQAIAAGAFQAFYAFIGFEDMVSISDEVRDVRRNMPRAIIASLAIATLVYLLVAWVAMSVLPGDVLARSDAPLADVFRQTSGRAPVAITLIGLVAVVNGALVQMVMGARILYGMASRGWLPAWLGSVNERTATPLASTALVTAAVLVLALAFRTLELALLTNVLLLTVFALVNAALVRVKLTAPEPLDSPVFPLAVPVTGCLVSVLFVGIALLAF